LEAYRNALGGRALWRRGQSAAALPAFENTQWVSRSVQWWLGKLYLELDRPRDAERIFGSRSGYLPPGFSVEPLAQYHLGQIYERLAEYDKALKAYEYFVENWQAADPELRPMVEKARQARTRLGV